MREFPAIKEILIGHVMVNPESPGELLEQVLRSNLPRNDGWQLRYLIEIFLSLRAPSEFGPLTE